jgi:ferritin-like protein
MKIIGSPAEELVVEADKVTDLSRRRFFQLAGGIAGAGILLSACHGRTAATDISLGSGDVGLLNYVYILQQLEADFYTQAVSTYYNTISSSELVLMTDLRDQEIAHKKFIQAILGNNAIPDILPNFSAATFADRASLLTFAFQLEDLVISGLNGVVQFFTNTTHIYSLSKMVTAEARHSAYLRDILSPNSFGNSSVISSNGLDQTASPGTVIAKAKAYTLSKIDSSTLPN